MTTVWFQRYLYLRNVRTFQEYHITRLMISHQYFLRYVLNYLRNDELFCPDDKLFRKELLAEARFYRLQGMIVCLNRLSLESVILKRNDEHLSAVISWLPSGSSFSLLFRASADGNSSESFHSYSDNNGPTLVVAKSETCIMGGFTSQSWTSHEFAFVVFEVTNFVNYI